MFDPRTQYLHSLGPDLSPETRDEIAAHLDASIQARVELGDSPEEAAQNAVAAMGAPTLVKDDRSVSAKRLSVASMAFVVYAPLYLLLLPFAFFGDTIHPEFAPLYGLLGLGLLGWVLGVSVRQERAAPKRLLPGALGAGLGVWLVMGLVWIDMGAEGSAGIVPRWEISSIREKKIAEMRAPSRTMGVSRTSQSDIDALDAAANRTPVERLTAEFSNGAKTAAVFWALLALANLIGVVLGWVGRHLGRRKVHA